MLDAKGVVGIIENPVEIREMTLQMSKAQDDHSMASNSATPALASVATWITSLLGFPERRNGGQAS